MHHDYTPNTKVAIQQESGQWILLNGQTVVEKRTKTQHIYVVWLLEKKRLRKKKEHDTEGLTTDLYLQMTVRADNIWTLSSAGGNKKSPQIQNMKVLILRTRQVK